MAADAQSQMRVTGNGTVTVRQRPALLLMKLSLHAAEATLELGLTSLKKQCEAASRWLKRLDAVQVDFGEPHFAGQTDPDPLKGMRAVTALALGKRPARTPSTGRRRDVNVVVTALWDIATMSPEQTLVLVDRLQFEATDDAGAAEPAEEIPGWATQEEQVEQIMAQIAEPPAEDPAPHFLFIARLSEEQMEKASAEAFALARRNAERFARALGMRLGQPGFVHCGVGDMDPGRADKLMHRQRCAALLAGCTYDLGENEVVSDDPRSAEFTIKVGVQYQLE